MKFLLIFLLIILFSFGVYYVIIKLQKNNSYNGNKNYIIQSFVLKDISSNDMAQDGARKIYYFSVNENVIEFQTPNQNKCKTITLNENQREKLEQDLLSLIEKYSIKQWNKFDESLDVFDDFHNFNFSIEYFNGKKITAKGTHSFPEKYFDTIKEIQNIFLKLIK